MKLHTDIRAIIFDLDNTLIDRDAAMKKSFSHWLKMQGTIDPDKVNRELDLVLQKDNSGYNDILLLCEWLISTYGSKHTKHNSSPKDTLRGIQEHAISHLQPNPELLRLLELLKQKYFLAIATNGSHFIQCKKAEKAQLPQIIDPARIYSSESIGYSKPRPEFFDRVLLSMNYPAHHCIMVGDHYENDVESAKNSGLHTCWINSKKITGGKAADSIFTDITDIAQWI